MKRFYSTGLRLLSWMALCAGVITSSCKKDDSNNGGGGGEPTPPPVTLNDQIEYNGGDLIDIKSAVYAVDEENANLFTFYLSPTEGIKTVKEMEAADDYLKVMVEEPAGTVDTQAQLFSIDYEDISVSKTSMVGYANVNLSVNLLEQTSRLVLYVDVKTESGMTLLVRYNNTCTLYELPTLNNQYGIDDQATKIGSVVEYVCSWGQEALFGSRSWDYSNIPFNLNGRICLLYSVFWGVLGVLWIKDLYPRMAKWILKIPNRAGKILTWCLVAFLAVNAAVTCVAVARWSQRVQGKEAGNSFWSFVDERFPDERMERIFANMEFGQSQS